SIYGKLNADRSNAILVFHALTGSSKISEWWGDVLGEDLGLDISKYAFVCVNYLGSCYGSTSAGSLRKRSTSPGETLPVITTRDIARTNFHLMPFLGIRKFRAVVGASVGGMLALQFVSDFPEASHKCVAIGAVPLPPMGLALNHLQRQALMSGDIEMARKIAMISYKGSEFLEERFSRNPNRNGEKPENDHESRFDVAGYLDHQGDIFRSRFDIESYKLITKAMDLFDLTDTEISRIEAEVSLVGISTDWLFPARDVQKFNEKLTSLGVNSRYVEFESNDGHDAFLSDVKTMNDILKEAIGGRSQTNIVV
ncbi:MAG: alpha/beta fold hydrolase, partial [Acidobacteria bacterium]|nr:alpha/beta fold hydrolase [Acidobacteriota bacterium]